MLSFSPLSFPTTRTSKPTLAPSGFKTISSASWNASAFGSNLKNAKSCTGSAYSARSGTSSLFWNTASATTGPGRRTWRFVSKMPLALSTTNPVAYALEAASVSKARVPVVLMTTTALLTRVTVRCHFESAGARLSSGRSSVLDASSTMARGGGSEAPRVRGEEGSLKRDPARAVFRRVGTVDRIEDRDAPPVPPLVAAKAGLRGKAGRAATDGGAVTNPLAQPLMPRPEPRARAVAREATNETC